MKKKFEVAGMTCAACQAHVQKALEKTDGVKNVSVNLLKNTALVEYDEKICSDESLARAVDSAGYKLVFPKAAESKTAVKDYSLAKLIVCIALLLILMYFSMGNAMWNFPAPKVFDCETNPMGFALLQFLLVLPVLFIYRNYFTSGFKKLFKGKPNMDSLIAVGATVSIAYGIFCLFVISYAQASISSGGDAAHWQDVLTTYRGSLYFESAGMILTLVSLGKYLEGLSKKKTTAAVTKLMDLAPKRAVVVRDGEEVEIPSEEVRIDDILIVKNGASVPVDGIITEGSASLNQANITGESMPVFKKEGDEVYSSTTVAAGYFKMKAKKVGEDTSIAAIIRLVDEASNSKAPISKLADKISGIFVPIIFAIALVTLIVNLAVGSPFELALNFAVSVVVIACPCALGLATPVSIMAGTGKGAQCGLLIKNAEILEKAHLIKTVVLDKTGTITEGKPKVTDFEEYFDGVLSAVYSIEAKSEHPLALSVVEFAKSKGATLFDVKDYSSQEGKGLTGVVNGAQFAIGNLRIANEGEISAQIKAKLDSLANEGKTPMIILRDGELAGLIAVKDTVKAGSARAIRELEKRGVNVVMLTGDNEATANAIAKEIGVSKVIAEVYPADKQRVVESLKTDKKHLVAMVGDGVNDAPALTAADLGIAVGGGSDVAMECSDIVLLRNDLMDVLNVISLSRRVLNTIRLGLFWAFFYNFICVLIATGAFYYINGFKINPMIGALAMSLSSTCVVLNALTINFFKVKRNEPQNDCEGACPLIAPPQSAIAGATEIIENQGDNNAVNEVNNMKKYVFNVKGMMCGMCEKHVNAAVKSIDGVNEVSSSHETGITEALCRGDIDVAAAKAAIEQAGYEVTGVAEA